MTLENGVFASNSLTASSAPAPSHTSVSDEEYARRLYAELNGSLFKTRRSAKSVKVVSAEAPEGAASKAVSSVAHAVTAAAEPAAAQSEKQLSQKPVEHAAKPQSAPSAAQDSMKAVATVRKLTGIQKELQRLLGDPVPVRSSSNSRQKSTASLSAAPGSKDEGDNVQSVASDTKQQPPEVDCTSHAQPQLDCSDRPQRQQNGDIRSARSASCPGAQATPAVSAIADSSFAPATKPAAATARIPAPSTTKQAQAPTNQSLEPRSKPSRHAPAAKEAPPAPTPPQQDKQPSAAPQQGSERTGRSAEHAPASMRTRRASSSSGRQQEQAAASTDPPHQAAVKPEPTSEPPAGAQPPPRSSQRTAAKGARGPEDTAAPAPPRTRSSSPAVRISVLAQPKEVPHEPKEEEDKAAAPTPIVQPPKALFKRQADRSAGGSTAPRKQQRVAAEGAASSKPSPSLTPPMPSRTSPPQPHRQPEVKHELASITHDSPLAPQPSAAPVDEPSEPQSRPPSSRLASRRSAAASTPAPKPCAAPAPASRQREAPRHPTPSHVLSSSAPPSRPPKAPGKGPIKARRIPKMPMVRYSKKWYRAKVVKQQGSRVVVEFPGLAFAPIELDCESDRIWTGSYKGKDWRHLGEGAWEPKKHAFKGLHSRSSASSTPTSTANTGRQSHSGAPDAGTDTEQGEQTSKQHAAPQQDTHIDDAAFVEDMHAECLSMQQEDAADTTVAAAVLTGHVMRKTRTSRSQQQHHGKASPTSAALPHADSTVHEPEEKHAAAATSAAAAAAVAAEGAVSTPSCSSQEHAATWHEPVADDCHSEDGAVNMAAPRQPSLPPIHTSRPCPAHAYTASCSADAGTTPHTASVSASTQADALLSFVGSCAADVAAAAVPAEGKTVCGEKGGREQQQGAGCVESVVTSCSELQVSAVEGTAGPGAMGGSGSRPGSPRELVVPHRCRRKGKPMRARIDCEEDPLPLAQDSAANAPSTSANQHAHFATSKQPLLAPIPLLSATSNPTTPSSSANDGATAPHAPAPAFGKPCPLEVCPKQSLFSCTFSNSVATNHASSAEPSPQPNRQLSLASSTSYPGGSTHSSPTTLPASSDPLDGEHEGAALLASLRHQKLALCSTVEAAAAAAAAAAAKRRRRGNGWTKIMRPSRPAHHHAPPAPVWEDCTTAAVSSIQGSTSGTMTATHGPESAGLVHSPRVVHQIGAKRVHLDSDALAAVRSPRRAAAAADITSRPPEPAATASHSSPALHGASPRSASVGVGSKRLWDAIDRNSLVAAVSSCSGGGAWPGVAALGFGGGDMGVASTPVHVAEPSGWGEGPIGGGGLPGSILSYLRQVQAPTGLMGFPALCRHEPMPFAMAFPPKPPMPLFKPVSE